MMQASRASHLLDLLLRPFEISLDFLRGFHALREVRAGPREPSAGFRLQSEQFLILRIQLTGPVIY